MPDVRDQFLYSLSARDLIGLGEKHPGLAREVAAERPLLALILERRRPLQEALYRERIELMLADEERLSAYMQVAKEWSAAWPEVRRRIAGLPLPEAHGIMVERAEGVLPFEAEADDSGERNGRGNRSPPRHDERHLPPRRQGRQRHVTADERRFTQMTTNGTGEQPSKR